MQDNLEFLQWAKKYWDQHYPGGDYDAIGRRKASGAPAPSAAGTRSGASSSAGATRRGATPTGAVRPRVSGAAGGASTAALQQEIATQKEAIAGLEKERDFYFAKLRDIELLLQNAIEADPELEKEEDSLVKHIQGILYSTEVRVPVASFASDAKSSQEGFEIPAEAEVADELETF
jgi:RP/EB family microtubule-associated protein